MRRHMTSAALMAFATSMAISAASLEPKADDAVPMEQHPKKLPAVTHKPTGSRPVPGGGMRERARRLARMGAA